MQGQLGRYIELLRDIFPSAGGLAGSMGGCIISETCGENFPLLEE
jgi:hypothetical protein